MDMVRQIAVASEQQTSGADEISRNVEAISTVTQQASKSAEQLAITADNLNKQTGSLRQIVDQFALRDSESIDA